MSAVLVMDISKRFSHSSSHSTMYPPRSTPARFSRLQHHHRRTSTTIVLSMQEVMSDTCSGHATANNDYIGGRGQIPSRSMADEEWRRLRVPERRG